MDFTAKSAKDAKIRPSPFTLFALFAVWVSDLFTRD
jgi:hypothetical protein